ncbi:tRNA1(Val) (adenine(37)-N6)-methyltransferase [Lentibacillus salicampi]|uniref:tRNA1(Val) (Adenine(37)-N6)-methyltransferase n=1 Tax=Lentibacillus salicampi TaxID=175306 RepID=A0A4Y9AB48_9BACI|nr:tRNA1(Val) (adenine(37)-N6)-methyltransferase [Lentibacillus salicampi]TFJ93016.1 tRNA1(Val) (adenine(37)-N6)-methyltransferase [Lentibacillus salicampi]
MVQLFDDERFDYLLAEDNMHIIQSPDVFAFSLDAVLLAHFAYVPIKKGHILDLCTGNGVIPLLLSRRTHGSITGVEIQKRLFDMARRSVELNGLENRLTMIHGDLKEMKDVLGHSTFDVVTCNPPYFATPAKTEHNQNDHLTVARHEVHSTLEDVVKASKLHVRPGGKVAMVHRPGRLVDILTLFRQYKIEPKRLQLVYPKQGRDANMLLIEGVRDGRADLTILPPLYIYNDDHSYTMEAEGIIYGNQ